LHKSSSYELLEESGQLASSFSVDEAAVVGAEV
jgi:hypothetical protein